MNKSHELMQRRSKHIPRGLFNISSHAILEGHGAVITDQDGKEFIDFASGVAVLNTGHCHPKVVEAIEKQSRQYLHACFNLMLYEPYVDLAERLNSIVPVTPPRKSFFVNSGAEAVEHAVKLARHFTGRYELITFNFAYHGRTLLTTSMTGRVRSYRTGFGPSVPGIHRAPYPYCYRCPFHASTETCSLACFDSFKDLFLHTVPEGNVAAVVIEPILGEGGVVPAPAPYLHALDAFCRERSILLIMDEVQSGIGRTGYWTASDYYGIQPDIIITAKALASGLPIGSITGRADILDSPPPGGIGGTFCGNPLSCVAALATLDIIEEQNLLERARQIGKALLDTLKAWYDEFEIIGDVRGLGAWAGLELVADRATRAPASGQTGKFLKSCHKNGLMLLLAGPHSNVVRILPPLVISDAELNKGLDILFESLREVSRN